MARVSKRFSGPTQLVGLALEGVRADRPLFARPPEPGLPALFGDAFPRAHFLYHDYAPYRRDSHLAASRRPDGPTLSFAVHCEKPAEPHDLAVVYLPKSREEIAFVFASVGAALEPGTRVLIVGPKKSGIRSSKPLVEDYIGRVLSSRSARHCVLIEARKTTPAKPFCGRKAYRVEAFGRELHVVTLPGVFSHGRLDAGTGFLLDHLEPFRFETALDWGCGAGVIGTALALAHPDAHVHLVDSNAMAIESTRLTLDANGLRTDRVRPSDVFSDVDDRYDLIVANPPFHAGLPRDFSVPARLISEAGRHLTPAGRLVIVANAFINYLAPLRRRFRTVRVLAHDRRYRLIEARQPIERPA